MKPQFYAVYFFAKMEAEKVVVGCGFMRTPTLADRKNRTAL